MSSLFALDQVFPAANVVAGVLVLIVGFGFHFLGQLYSVVDWDRATQLGLQEAGAPPEYQVYERAIAVSDSLLGWTYGIAGIGLVTDAAWGYVWAWLPAVVLTYHSLGFWFWTQGQRRAGHEFAITRWPARQIWFLANLVTGLFTMLVASSQIVVA